MPQVGLFIPCYVDQLYPQVGMATLQVLERFGCQVDFPSMQTCCGQPMANTGCVDDAKPLAVKFVSIFKDYEYVVCPSGSCVAMVRKHYGELLHDDPDFLRVKSRTFELCEFLTDVLKIESIPGRFPHRVGLHNSCHGLRELRLASSSEMMVDRFNKAAQLLSGLEGIELVSLKRPDECWGYVLSDAHVRVDSPPKIAFARDAYRRNPGGKPKTRRCRSQAVMKDGFLGYHTSFMLDAVVIALVLVVPVLTYSLYSAKFTKNYSIHRNLQLFLAVTLLAAVTCFEVDLHLVQGGWQNVVKKGPEITSEQLAKIQRVLHIHLIFAGSTPFLWALTLGLALRNFPNPPKPSPHSRLHKVLGWTSALDLVLTSVTGLIFYYTAFVSRG
jgi:L-lactate dehydrogenase complex protein LldE